MMRQMVVMVGLLLLAAAGSGVNAGDLYEVKVGSHEDAATLRQVGVEPVLRVSGGYLVLVEAERLDVLLGSGLEVQLIEAGVEREELAIDIRQDESNVGRYPLVYAEGGLRLYRVVPGLIFESPEPTGLAPVLTGVMRIEYREPVEMPVVKDAQLMVDLDSLIAKVQQDSVQSYLERLQAFDGRVAGTDSNAAARDWLAGKFAEFGYDSIIIDSFRVNIRDVLTECQNVVAVKPGMFADQHHIIIGAHRDAVPGSPGADDNGSGSVGVLEIARALAEVETQATIIFILFDAEEWGLYGSQYYADRAAARGDSIIVMLNMDMIGHYENMTAARARWLVDSAYSSIWAYQAANRAGVNITSTDTSQGGGGSDHAPFGANGYPAIFVQEAIFSTEYHQPSDSTTYVSFDYLTRMIKATLATAYYVDQTYPFTPSVMIQAVEEPPMRVFPNRPDTFSVAVGGYVGGSVASGSEQLHYCVDGGPYEAASLVSLGGDQYLAILPLLPVASRVTYYLEAQEQGGTVFRWPISQDLQAVSAASQMTLLEDDFNGYQGWSAFVDGATAGFWERRQPVYGNKVPSSDYDGSGWCYLTEQDYGVDVDDGAVLLRSPLFSANNADELLVEYAWWYYGTPYSDRFRVQVSNDSGLTWFTARTYQSVEDSKGRWRIDKIWLGDMFSDLNKVRVRFEVADLGADSKVEAAVDAVRVIAFDNGEELVVADSLLPSWTVGQAYSYQLQHAGGWGVVTWQELTGQLPGLGLTLSASGLVTGVPTAAGTYGLTVVAADEIGREDTAGLALVLNAPVEVVTTALPDGKVGEAYAEPLAAAGGTTPLVWTETGDALSTVGLTLSSDGVVGGTPADPGTVLFTAMVTDAAGSADTSEFSLVIAPAFICGDIDGNGTGPNVADLTYFIAYLFRGGAAPPVIAAADVNGSGDIAVSDLTRLIDYLFRGGGPLGCL